MEAVKKTILRIEYDYDFHLWGIVTTLKDFQVCWEINQALRIKLKRKDDLEIQNPAKGRQLLFGLFAGNDRFEQGSFHLVANKYYNEYLIPEMKEIDYFLKYTCETGECELSEIFNHLKSVKRFVLVTKVNIQKLKSKHHLIFE